MFPQMLKHFTNINLEHEELQGILQKYFLLAKEAKNFVSLRLA